MEGTTMIWYVVWKFYSEEKSREVRQRLCPVNSRETGFAICKLYKEKEMPQGGEFFLEPASIYNTAEAFANGECAVQDWMKTLDNA